MAAARLQLKFRSSLFKGLRIPKAEPLVARRNERNSPVLRSAERGCDKVLNSIKLDGGEPADSGSPPHNKVKYASK